MSTERLVLIASKETFLLDAYLKSFIDNRSNLVLTGGRNYGRTYLKDYINQLEENKSKRKIELLNDQLKDLNKFNHAKHLATCAKNRRNRKSKKRN